MAITSAISNSFKVEILQGGHNFNDSSGAPTGNTFKISLYTSSATLSKSTTAYTAPTDGTADPTNTYEVSSTSTGYTTGGNTLVASADPVLSGDTACVKFDTTTWGSSASFTARGCLIYNTTSITGFTANRSVCAINFGADKTVTSGTFTIQFPAQTAGNAIIQIA
tara:strand:- start:148 stop:645 length:498 start_codon:yes stop_codon:yes gene_type:complete